MKRKINRRQETHDDSLRNRASPRLMTIILLRVTEDKRGALQKLRTAIKMAAPKAEECISYQVPAFRLNGKFLVAYGAAKNHCAFYPGSTVKALKNELKGYDTSKGTIRFSANKPLPSAWYGSW